ncbi:1,4-dihydroxy-2-naphthoate octaprenyltransferase [Methanolinea mesophila]|uniref:prenyltransferase n=1 Tax=Methanolinea mesophila TaxID=547055 RepID=UPI001AEB2F2C|nr:prenyltransferase [Methanolinea mesophila]MBP1930008.1 1,4-dihydroxy-2-naphthoate octaprenyltransferase [Methanolinea mesophila]
MTIPRGVHVPDIRISYLYCERPEPGPHGPGRGGDSTDPRTLRHILRIEGLLPFTGCAVLLGFVVTLWEAGFSEARWGLFVLAIAGAFLVHIDAHIWNDIMDQEIDRREKSEETGRDRPLLNGWATVSDYRKMSAVITVLVVIIAAYLTTQRIYIPLLFVLGFFFDYGYNHPRIALGHKPFTEWYIFPWLVVGVTVTLVYAATGIFSLLAFILSLLHGLTVTCFGVSMMRRDAPSDRMGGKCTSSVQYPGLPHSTIYGIITLLVAIFMLYPLTLILGSVELAYALILVTSIIAGVNTVLGARIDQLCTRAMYSMFPDFEKKANKLMLQQVGASMVHAIAISIILVVFGGIL